MQLPVLPPHFDWREFLKGFVVGLAICGGSWCLGFAMGYAVWPLIMKQGVLWR